MGFAVAKPDVDAVEEEVADYEAEDGAGAEGEEADACC